MTRHSDPLADPYLPNRESEEHVRREQQRLEETKWVDDPDGDREYWESMLRALERTWGKEGRS